jgi:hypothetical protein
LFFKLDQYQEILMSISTTQSKRKAITLGHDVEGEVGVAKCARNSRRIEKYTLDATGRVETERNKR